MIGLEGAVAQRPQRAAKSICTASSISELTAIYAPEVNVVSYPRALDPQITAEAAHVLCQPMFQIKTPIAATRAGRSRLLAMLSDAATIAADVHFWVEVLADLTGADEIGVRLAKVEAAMCPRFHVDRIAVRMVSTYVGAGTEYLSNDEVDRRWLGHAAAGQPDDSSGLLRSGARVHTAAAGALVLFKGEAWPGNTGHGAVHRSPQASASCSRLVMTLDPL